MYLHLKNLNTIFLRETMRISSSTITISFTLYSGVHRPRELQYLIEKRSIK